MACKNEDGGAVDLCQWIISCERIQTTLLVASGPKGGHAYVAGCSGARVYIYMCLTISLPSSEVMQNLRGVGLPLLNR